jgi:hypothetical protein
MMPSDKNGEEFSVTVPPSTSHTEVFRTVGETAALRTSATEHETVCVGENYVFAGVSF